MSAPDAAVLGEAGRTPQTRSPMAGLRCYFMGDTLDSVMNYPLRDMATTLCSAAYRRRSLRAGTPALAENYPKPALYSLMRI